VSWNAHLKMRTKPIGLLDEELLAEFKLQLLHPYRDVGSHGVNPVCGSRKAAVLGNRTEHSEPAHFRGDLSITLCESNDMSFSATRWLLAAADVGFPSD
jgi:hypothetical protein